MYYNQFMRKERKDKETERKKKMNEYSKKKK